MTEQLKQAQRLAHMEHQVDLLLEMQKDVDYHVYTYADSSIYNSKIPFLSSLMHELTKGAETATQVGEHADFFQGSTPNESMHHGFHLGTIIVSAVNFFRIPLIYLAAILLKEKIPFTISNNSQWLYASLILSLSLVSFLVSGVAIITGFIGATIGLTMGVYLLSRVLLDKYRLANQNRQIKSQIHFEELEMEKIQQEAAFLADAVKGQHDETERAGLYLDIAILIERFELQRIRIENLKNKEYQIESKLSQIQLGAISNRIVPVIFAATAVIGLVFSLVMPPVGAAILTGVSIASGAFLVGRLTIATGRLIKNWVSNPTESKTEDEELDDAPEPKVSLQPEKRVEMDEEDYNNSPKEVLSHLRTDANSLRNSNHDLDEDEDEELAKRPIALKPSPKKQLFEQSEDESDDDSSEERHKNK